MADPQSTRASKRDQDKGISEHASELWELIRDYAKQETIDPLKHLGAFVAWGLGAAILGATGIILVSIGLLRLLQEETSPHLTGSLTWVPYVIVLVVCATLTGLAFKAISKKPKPNRGER